MKINDSIYDVSTPLPSENSLISMIGLDKAGPLVSKVSALAGAALGSIAATAGTYAAMSGTVPAGVMVAGAAATGGIAMLVAGAATNVVQGVRTALEARFTHRLTELMKQDSGLAGRPLNGWFVTSRQSAVVGETHNAVTETHLVRTGERLEPGETIVRPAVVADLLKSKPNSGYVTGLIRAVFEQHKAANTVVPNSEAFGMPGDSNASAQNLRDSIQNLTRVSPKSDMQGPADTDSEPDTYRPR